MQGELKKIKKKYGEKMAKLCRTLFPTILETDGLLLSILESKYAHSKLLYDDIINNHLEDKFKNYIYGLIDIEKNNAYVDKKPVELLSDAGYILYECNSENDIQEFKKYYAKGEELCTFRGQRLDRCYVFFAIKKNVSEIKRENFKNPERQDEYGTSVISIQFTRDSSNTLSIKNRYNHSVNNPDATFSNNLENIIPGLTKSFESEYNLNINNGEFNFEIPGYIRANDGKYYKYNYEMNNVYYCPDNIIIDNFEVKIDYQDKSRYLIVDYFIIDLSTKKIKLYDKTINDSFVDNLTDIDKIVLTNSTDKNNKIIRINNDIVIIVDRLNRIVQYHNEHIKELENKFLFQAKYLEVLSVPRVEIIKDECLYYNINLNTLNAPLVRHIGNGFVYNNKNLKQIYMPNLFSVGNYFLFCNEVLNNIVAFNLREAGNGFLRHNKCLESFTSYNLAKVGDDFICFNKILSLFFAPNLQEIGVNCLSNNRNLNSFNANIRKIKEGFLFYNRNIPNDLKRGRR